MIINHTYNFVYIHIPKTAGTAIIHKLSELTEYRDIEIGGTPFGQGIAPYYRDRFKLRKHSTLNEIRAVLGEDLQSFKVISFVRNPVDRVISIYNFLKKWTAWDGSEKMNNFNNINEFVLSDFFLTRGPDNILQPQTFWLKNAGLYNKPEYLGKVEQLNDDLSSIFSTITDNKTTINLPVRNKSTLNKGKDMSELLNQNKVKQRILKRYKEDFINFNY